MANSETNSAYGNEQLRRRSLISEIKRRDSRDAAKLLMAELPMVAGQVLLELNPGQATAILERFSEDFVARVLASVPAEIARQWARNQAYPDGSIGRIMDPAIAVFPPAHQRGRRDRAPAQHDQDRLRDLRLRHG